MANNSRIAPRSIISRRKVLAATCCSIASAVVYQPTLAAMVPGEITQASAVALAAAIRRRELSSVEVVQAFLDRINRTAVKLNAVVTVVAEAALGQAAQADRDVSSGRPLGPLHGVPMTIKDSFNTAGIRSTAGVKAREEFIPERDATVVARLKAAGAILLGKTNTSELTMSYETNNEVFGRTNNPYNIAKCPGGSSGGAAAIVAAAGSPFDVGSDTGGSVRLPSGLCGAAGIKPTTGRVPLTGHIISFGQGIADSLTQAGPIARYVEDLGLVLRIIAGPDDSDPSVVSVPLKDTNLVDLKSLRVAYHTDNGILPADQEIAEVVQQAAKAMGEAKAVVRETRPAALVSTVDLQHRLWYTDANRWVFRLAKRLGTGESQNWQDWQKQSKALTGDEFCKLIEDWQQFRTAMHAFLLDTDVLLCPVFPHALMNHGDSPSEGLDEAKLFSYTHAYNFTGWPCAVIRCGKTNSGMPIGVQVVGHPWREDVVLAVARHLEKCFGGWQAPQL